MRFDPFPVLVASESSSFEEPGAHLNQKWGKEEGERGKRKKWTGWRGHGNGWFQIGDHDVGGT